MPLNSGSKYYLRDLHAEIDFYDRKIMHCEKHEHFDSETDRAAAIAKLVTKRATFAKKVLSVTESGVEYDVSTPPRSLKESSATSKESL